MAAAADRPPRKPISAAQKGAYYKGRSKKWLQAHGYEVWDMEKVHTIYAGGARIPVKRDQLGADLGAMTGMSAVLWEMGIKRLPPRPDYFPHPEPLMGEIVFIQVKGGATARSGLAAARRAFRQYDFPNFVKRHIHVWIPRARAPEIIDCSAEEYDPPCEAKSKRSRPAKTSAS